MTYFLKLDLPTDPLRDINAPEIQGIVPRQHRVLLPDVLTDELLNRFKEIGLRPKFVLLFCSNNKQARLEHRMIHSDLTIDDAGKWIKCTFGVNWEINGSWNEFLWWDMDQVEEFWPEHHTPGSVLNGIHYYARRHTGVPPSVNLIAKTVIDGPTLVRTDAPHSTVYKNETKNRIGISVRFYEDEFKDWNDVVEKLKPYELRQD